MKEHNNDKQNLFNEKEIIILPFEKCTKFIITMNFTPFLNHGFYICNHSFVNCEHDLFTIYFVSFQGYEILLRKENLLLVIGI